MVHTFLIAHPKKINKDRNTGIYEVPTLYDINGSANFFNKTDNGITVYRDFDLKKTTMYVQKIKFRHLGTVGQEDFTYDMVCGRYTPAAQQHDRKSWITLPHMEQAEMLIGEEPKPPTALQPNTSFIIESADDMPF
jgi:hypothetical protein